MANSYLRITLPNSSQIITISTTDGELICAMRICSALLGTSLAVNFGSVRGYGLRTYEPRQGRNAATVV